MTSKLMPQNCDVLLKKDWLSRASLHLDTKTALGAQLSMSKLSLEVLARHLLQLLEMLSHSPRFLKLWTWSTIRAMSGDITRTTHN